MPGWRESWLGWRNRRLMDPRFQRWAARFPLTRPVATRKARQVFDLVAGFVYSQTLSACVQLGLLEILARGPQGTAALAEAVNLPEERALRLLRAAASLGLVETLPGGRWALGEAGAALLGNPGALAMIAHHDMLYADLADPVGLLRGEVATQLSSYWPYAVSSDPAGADAQGVAGYSALMAASQPLVAEDILEAYPLGRHRRLMDVGGGEGAFLAAVAKAVPALELMLFDLPAVAERARARFGGEARESPVTGDVPATAPIGSVTSVRSMTETSTGADAGKLLRGRRPVAIHGGDFTRDALPRGADVVTLVRIVHDHDDARVAALMRAVHDALPPGGTVLVAEPMAGAKGAEPMGDAYFGFYLLAMGSGRARRPAEIAALLTAAGFVDPHEIATRRPLLTGLMTARRP